MCCGKSSKTASPASARVSNLTQLRVGDNVRPIKWKWRAIGTQEIDRESGLLADATIVSDSEILFPSEPAFNAWVASGHPGTKNVVAV